MSEIVQNTERHVNPRCFKCRRILFDGLAEIPISSVLLCEECYRTFTSERPPAELRAKLAEFAGSDHNNPFYAGFKRALHWVLKEGEEI
jgi:hypothetical protein